MRVEDFNDLYDLIAESNEKLFTFYKDKKEIVKCYGFVINGTNENKTINEDITTGLPQITLFTKNNYDLLKTTFEYDNKIWQVSSKKNNSISTFGSIRQDNIFTRYVCNLIEDKNIKDEIITEDNKYF